MKMPPVFWHFFSSTLEMILFFVYSPENEMEESS